MGSRQHRHGGEFPGTRGDRGAERAQLGEHYRIQGVAQHQPVGQVVDVFRGAGEVHEFAVSGQAAQFRQPLLDEVFDRLDVVVGDRLDGLDALGGGGIELGFDPLERCLGSRRQGR